MVDGRPAGVPFTTRLPSEEGKTTCDSEMWLLLHSTGQRLLLVRFSFQAVIMVSFLPSGKRHYSVENNLGLQLAAVCTYARICIIFFLPLHVAITRFLRFGLLDAGASGRLVVDH